MSTSANIRPMHELCADSRLIPWRDGSHLNTDSKLGLGAEEYLQGLPAGDPADDGRLPHLAAVRYRPGMADSPLTTGLRDRSPAEALDKTALHFIGERDLRLAALGVIADLTQQLVQVAKGELTSLRPDQLPNHHDRLSFLDKQGFPTRWDQAFWLRIHPSQSLRAAEAWSGLSADEAVQVENLWRRATYLPSRIVFDNEGGAWLGLPSGMVNVWYERLSTGIARPLNNDDIAAARAGGAQPSSTPSGYVELVRQLENSPANSQALVKVADAAGGTQVFLAHNEPLLCSERCSPGCPHQERFNLVFLDLGPGPAAARFPKEHGTIELTMLPETMSLDERIDWVTTARQPSSSRPSWRMLWPDGVQPYRLGRDSDASIVVVGPGDDDALTPLLEDLAALTPEIVQPIIVLEGTGRDGRQISVTQIKQLRSLLSQYVWRRRQVPVVVTRARLNSEVESRALSAVLDRFGASLVHQVPSGLDNPWTVRPPQDDASGEKRQSVQLNLLLLRAAAGHNRRSTHDRWAIPEADLIPPGTGDVQAEVTKVIRETWKKYSATPPVILNVKQVATLAEWTPRRPKENLRDYAHSLLREILQLRLPGGAPGEIPRTDVTSEEVQPSSVSSGDTAATSALPEGESTSVPTVEQPQVVPVQQQAQVAPAEHAQVAPVEQAQVVPADVPQVPKPDLTTTDLPESRPIETTAPMTTSVQLPSGTATAETVAETADPPDSPARTTNSRPTAPERATVEAQELMLEAIYAHLRGNSHHHLLPTVRTGRDHRPVKDLSIALQGSARERANLGKLRWLTSPENLTALAAGDASAGTDVTLLGKGKTARGSIIVSAARTSTDTGLKIVNGSWAVITVAKASSPVKKPETGWRSRLMTWFDRLASPTTSSKPTPTPVPTPVPVVTSDGGAGITFGPLLRTADLVLPARVRGVLLKPEPPQAAHPRSAGPRRVPDRTAHPPVLPGFSPTRRGWLGKQLNAATAADPSPVATQLTPTQVRSSLQAMSSRERRVLRTEAVDLLEARLRHPGTTAQERQQLAEHRQELYDRICVILKMTESWENHLSRSAADRFVAEMIVNGPVPEPSPPFDPATTVTLDVGGTRLRWDQKARTEAFLRSVTRENEARVGAGLSPLCVQVVTDQPGRGRAGLKAVHQLVAEMLLNNRSARSTAEVSLSPLTPALRGTDIHGFLDRPRNRSVTVTIGVLASPPIAPGSAPTTEAAFDRFLTEQRGVALNALSVDVSLGEALKYQAKPAAGAPSTSRPAVEKLDWAPTTHGFQLTAEASLTLEELDLRAAVPADAEGVPLVPPSLISAVTSSGVFHAVPGMQTMTSTSPQEWLAIITGLLAHDQRRSPLSDPVGAQAEGAQAEAATAETVKKKFDQDYGEKEERLAESVLENEEGELQALLRGWPMLGLPVVDAVTRDAVQQWIDDGLPAQEVPEALLRAVTPSDAPLDPSAGTMIIIQLTAALLGRPIRLVLSDGRQKQFAADGKGSSAAEHVQDTEAKGKQPLSSVPVVGGPELVVVQDQDGNVLATVPQVSVPTLLSVVDSGVLETRPRKSLSTIYEDGAAFTRLKDFLRKMTGNPRLELAATEELVHRFRKAAIGRGESDSGGLAEVLSRTRAYAQDQARPNAPRSRPEPSPVHWLPASPQDGDPNVLTDFQFNHLAEAGLAAVHTDPGGEAVFEALGFAALNGPPQLSGFSKISDSDLRTAFAALIAADFTQAGGQSLPILGINAQAMGELRPELLTFLAELATPGVADEFTAFVVGTLVAKLSGVRVNLVFATEMQTIDPPESTTNHAPVLHLVVAEDGHVMPTVASTAAHRVVRASPAPADAATAEATSGARRVRSDGESARSKLSDPKLPDPSFSPDPSLSLPEPDSIVHRIAFHRGNLPHIDEVTEQVIKAFEATGQAISHEGGQIVRQRVLSNYHQLVQEGHLIRIGKAEVLVQLDPTHPAWVSNPAGSYTKPAPGSSDPKAPARAANGDGTFRSNQATHMAIKTGGHSHSNSGQAGAVRAKLALGLAIGIAPGVLQVLRAGVTIIGTANQVDRSTTAFMDAEHGQVEDNRMDSVLLSYAPNWKIKSRTEPQKDWAKIPARWNSAQAYVDDAGKDSQDRLFIWIAEDDLKAPGPQVTAVAPETPGTDQDTFLRNIIRLPDSYFATGLTGLTELYEKTVLELVAAGVKLRPDGPELEQLRQGLWQLNVNLTMAINDPQGYPITLNNKWGKPVATVNVHTQRVHDNTVRRVGATSKRSHLERIRNAIEGLSGRESLKNESAVQASAQIDLIPVPGLTVGPAARGGWTGTLSEAISSGRTGLWVLVSRYTGRTVRYDLPFRHTASVAAASRPDAPSRTTEAVPGRALLRVSETDAFAHGLPVDVTALKNPPEAGITEVSYTPDAIDDGSKSTEEIDGPVRLPHHISETTTGMSLISHHETVIERMRRRIYPELQRVGLIPADLDRPFSKENAGPADMNVGTASQLANLRLLEKMISIAGFDSNYDPIHQDGLTFTLRGDPTLRQASQARVTIRGYRDREDLRRVDAEGNSVHHARRTPNFHLVNLGMGMTTASHRHGGARKFSAGLRFAAGFSMLQTHGWGVEYGRSTSVAQWSNIVTNRPELLEYPGDLDEYRLRSTYQATIDYGDLTTRARRDGKHNNNLENNGKTWQSDVLVSWAKVHLLPSINTQEQPPTLVGTTDPSVIEQAVIMSLDTQGLLAAGRQLLPKLTGPSRPSDEEVSTFLGQVMTHAFFKEILADEYQTSHIFKPGYVRDTMGALALKAELRGSAFVGSTADQFTLGLIKLLIDQAGSSRTEGHSVSVDSNTRTGGDAAQALHLKSANLETGARYYYGRNRTQASVLSAGKELLELSFHRVYAFATEVDFVLRGVTEKHAKVLLTGVDLPADKQVDKRQMLYLLAEPHALAAYGDGHLPVDTAQLLDALRRWQGTRLESDETPLELSSEVVSKILTRLDTETASDSYAAERAGLWQTVHSGIRDALQVRLAKIGKTVDELAMPAYLTRNNALGHHGIESMKLRKEVPHPDDAGNHSADLAGTGKDAADTDSSFSAELSPLRLIRDVVEEVAPGILGPLGADWTSENERESTWGFVNWVNDKTGGRPVLGSLVTGLDYLSSLVSGRREQALSENLMHRDGSYHYLHHKVGGVLADVVEINNKITLTSEPKVVGFVPGTGLENYNHQYEEQQHGTSKDRGFSLTAPKVGFAGKENTDQTSGGPQIDSGTAHHSSNTQAQVQVHEQTVYDWSGHYLVEIDHRLDIAVKRLNMAGRPLNNMLASTYRALKNYDKMVKHSYAGKTVLKIPRGLMEGTALTVPRANHDLAPIVELPGDKYLTATQVDDALPALWQLLGRTFGPQANDLNFRSSINTSDLVSRTMLTNHLHRTAGGKRLQLSKNTILSGNSPESAEIFLLGEFHSLEMLEDITDGTGMGNYDKSQTGTTIGAGKDHLRGAVTLGVAEGPVIGAQDASGNVNATGTSLPSEVANLANLGDAWKTDNINLSTSVNRISPQGDGIGDTVNSRGEGHLKQQGRTYLIKMTFKGHLEADRYDNSIFARRKLTGVFKSDPFFGPVFAKVHSAELAVMQAQMEERRNSALHPDQRFNPARSWPHPLPDTPRYQLDSRLFEASRTVSSWAEATTRVSEQIRDDARSDRLVLSSSATRRALEHHLAVQDWAIRQLRTSAPQTAARLRSERTQGRVDLIWQTVQPAGLSGEAIARVAAETQDLLKLVETHAGATSVSPPLAHEALDWDPIQSARHIAHNLKRHVQLENTRMDGTKVIFRIDPTGRVYRLNADGTVPDARAALHQLAVDLDARNPGAQNGQRLLDQAAMLSTERIEDLYINSWARQQSYEMALREAFSDANRTHPPSR